MSAVANIINVLIGIYLTYVAIFAMPADGGPNWQLAAAAVLIVVLAIFARRGDYSGWQSATNIVLGLILLVLSLIGAAVAISPLINFWIDLWVGLAVATFALWALLYHPEPGSGSV